MSRRRAAVRTTAKSDLIAASGRVRDARTGGMEPERRGSSLYSSPNISVIPLSSCSDSPQRPSLRSAECAAAALLRVSPALSTAGERSAQHQGAASVTLQPLLSLDAGKTPRTHSHTHPHTRTHLKKHWLEPSSQTPRRLSEDERSFNPSPLAT